MPIRFLLTLILLALGPMTYASDRDSITQEEVFIDDLGRLPESFDMSLDSLLKNRYREYYNLSKPQNRPSEQSRTLDQLYRKRVHAMESAIPLTYNPIVREAIEMYVNRRSGLLGNMLAKSTYYFPIIEEALDRHGLPLELKYLAIVESALNPTAVSRVGATGLWQFMLPTGKAYGLHIDSLIDERRDPRKSSEAMSLYFKDMYALYGDWMLAIAAYNCGPGNVNKAIRRSGGKRNFWEIYQYLPRETRSYVPFFIAAFYAMEHYDEHNVRPNLITMPLATDTIHINSRQNFETLSRLTNVDIETMRELNPKYRREIVPGNTEPQVLILPAANAIYFGAHKDSILKVNEPAIIQTQKETITHTVARGENLAKIAQQYGVNIEDIKKWNGLRGTRISRGQRLRIELIQSRELTEQEITAGIEPTEIETQPVEKPKTRYYTVKRGDTLSGIAKKHRGATVTKIRNANNIRGNMIKPGQRLVIPY